MQNVGDEQDPFRINKARETDPGYEFLGISPEEMGIENFCVCLYPDLNGVLEYMKSHNFDRRTVVILDNDGVLHHGTKEVDNASELIKALKEDNKNVVVATNIKSGGILRRLKRPNRITESFLNMGLERKDIYYGQNRQDPTLLCLCLSRPDLPCEPTRNRELSRFEASSYLNLVNRISETVKDGGDIHLVADEPWLRKQINLLVGGREEYFLYRIANDLKLIYEVDLDQIHFYLHIIDRPVDMPLPYKISSKILNWPRRKIPVFRRWVNRVCKQVYKEM